MESSKVRKIVREVLFEMEMAIGGGGFDSNNDISRFHGYPSGYGQFPHLHPDMPELPEMLPTIEDIRKGNNADFDKLIKNNEVYDFPIEYFKAGLEQETEKFRENKNYINLFDVAREVLKNLEASKDFYKIQNKDSDGNKGDSEHIEDDSIRD